MTLKGCTKAELLWLIDWMCTHSMFWHDIEIERALNALELEREQKKLDEADRLNEESARLRQQAAELLTPYEGNAGPILSDEEQIPRAELRAALDYLQESGYIAARTVKDHTPAHVSDLPLEDMECKLRPAGVQLLGGHIKDPLVRP